MKIYGRTGLYLVAKPKKAGIQMFVKLYNNYDSSRSGLGVQYTEVPNEIFAYMTRMMTRILNMHRN